MKSFGGLGDSEIREISQYPNFLIPIFITFLIFAVLANAEAVTDYTAAQTSDVGAGVGVGDEL